MIPDDSIAVCLVEDKACTTVNGEKIILLKKADIFPVAYFYKFFLLNITFPWVD